MQQTSYIYLISKDKYLAHWCELLTSYEVDYYESIERDWIANKPRYNLKDLLEIFPEAIKPARRGLKNKLKKYKEELIFINNLQQKNYDEFISKAHFSLQVKLKEISDKGFEERRKLQEKKIKSLSFELSYLDQLEGKVKPPDKNAKGVTEIEIAEAKQVPIENFYTDKLSKRGTRSKGVCPFHNEKSASFTIYLDQNSFYCYGCHEGGSVVDFIIKQQGIDFLSAVKYLIT